MLVFSLTYILNNAITIILKARLYTDLTQIAAYMPQRQLNNQGYAIYWISADSTGTFQFIRQPESCDIGFITRPCIYYWCIYTTVHGHSGYIWVSASGQLDLTYWLIEPLSEPMLEYC